MSINQMLKNIKNTVNLYGSILTEISAPSNFAKGKTAIEIPTAHA